MVPDVFHSLIDYNYWARDKLLMAVGQLAESDYFAPRAMDYTNIHGTLAHLLGAEIIWNSRWAGVSPSRIPGGGDFVGLADLSSRWRDEEGKIRTFLADASDAEILSRVIHYRSTEGQAHSRSAWEVLVHLVNHGTHHRSEVAAAVTQLGHSPGDLDMIVYFNGKKI